MAHARQFELGTQRFTAQRVVYNGHNGYIWTRTIYRDDLQGWTHGGKLFARLSATREHIVAMFADSPGA